MAVSIAQLNPAGTPTNTNKDGNFIRILLRHANSNSPALSPVSGTLVITNAQLQTRAPRGALRRIFRAFDDGLSAAAGITRLTALTKAQAREIMDSRCASPSTPSVLTTSRTPRAKMSIKGCAAAVGMGASSTVATSTSNSSSAGMCVWECDASVDASGRPTALAKAFRFSSGGHTTTASNTAAIQAAYAFLDIEYCHPITGR